MATRGSCGLLLSSAMMLRQLRRAAPLARAARAFSSVPDTMAAAVVHETGGADVLTVESAWPVPTLADGQVRPLLRPRQPRRSALASGGRCS